MSIRSAAALGAALLTAAVLVGPAAAHDGHDHGTAGVETPRTVAPRGEARSWAFELVAVARNGSLTLYLDDARTNEPVRDAGVTVETPEGPRPAIPAEDGAYRLAAPWAGTPGRHDLVATVVTGVAVDVLALVLDVPEPMVVADSSTLVVHATVAALARQVRGRLPGGDLALAALAGSAFLLGMLAAALLRGRRAAPALAVLALAVTALLGTAAFADGDDHGGPIGATPLDVPPPPLRYGRRPPEHLDVARTEPAPSGGPSPAETFRSPGDES